MSRVAWLVGGGLIALYAVNVAANAIYNAATNERIELLQERIATLSRVSPGHKDIGEIRRLIAQSGFSNFTTLISTAIARRAALADYLNRHPHVVIGLAIDGQSPTDAEVARVLVRINQEFKPYRISIGLGQPIARMTLPAQATREDLLRGTTSVFNHQPDSYIALTSRPCRYADARVQSDQPDTNRVYSFGLRKLAFFDGVVPDAQLGGRLLIELSNLLAEKFEERRWRKADYDQRFEDTLRRQKILGRVVREPPKRPVQDQDVRAVPVIIGLDNVSQQDARSYIDDINAKFAEFRIRFEIKRVYQHRLQDRWKWPLEIQRMQKFGDGELFILLTSDEWISPTSGHVRGLGSGFFGSIMVQEGTRQQTILRLMHEIGHQFQLPHSLQEGSVMYPNETHIGFDWSPGNRRRLNENRLSATWHSSKTYRDRFNIAIRLAPEMVRSGRGQDRAQPDGFAASQDAWVTCQ
ncbi:MAG: hypothetical protein AAGB04_28860 [Pseudomonadota bacterium]